MSTLTSSVINKSGKTVAPKAAARRRPAAARPSAAPAITSTTATTPAVPESSPAQQDNEPAPTSKTNEHSATAQPVPISDHEQSSGVQSRAHPQQPAPEEVRFDADRSDNLVPTPAQEDTSGSHDSTTSEARAIASANIGLEDVHRGPDREGHQSEGHGPEGRERRERQEEQEEQREQQQVRQERAVPQEDQHQAPDGGPLPSERSVAESQSQEASRTNPLGSNRTEGGRSPIRSHADLLMDAATGSGPDEELIEGRVEDSVRRPPPKPKAGIKRKRKQPTATTSRSQEDPVVPTIEDQVSNGLSQSQNAPVAKTAGRKRQKKQQLSDERVRDDDEGEEGEDRTRAPQTVKKPRAKRPRKPAATAAMDVDARGHDGDIADQDADSAVQPVKKPRARKSRKLATPAEAESNVQRQNSENMDQDADMPIPKAKTKTKKPRKKSGAEQGDGENGETGDQDAAEDESSDPELHEIDVTATTMMSLARDQAYGRTSERGRKMQGIDWAEVKRKRMESVPAPTLAQADADGNAEGGGDDEDAALGATMPGSGVRLRMVNGEMVVDEESTQIDRQAQAEEAARNLQMADDDDLTKLVNRGTWINDRRRDPAERVPIYKMKSDPWNDQDTDRFYDALRMFGTDFFIISKMFPPKTRRQIKLKFVREERLDPERVNAALAGQSMPLDLQIYAEATGREVNEFKDPRAVEEELRAEGEEQRVEIEKKKTEYADAQKQRDIQMESREKEKSERDAQKQVQKAERAAIRARKRKGQMGTGTL